MGRQDLAESTLEKKAKEDEEYNERLKSQVKKEEDLTKKIVGIVNYLENNKIGIDSDSPVNRLIFYGLTSLKTGDKIHAHIYVGEIKYFRKIAGEDLIDTYSKQHAVLIERVMKKEEITKQIDLIVTGVVFDTYKC